MDTLVNNATSSFQTTTGFSLQSVATWMWDNLAEPILGGGLATLYTLRFYIIAVVMLAIIVYFGYRLFTFYRH
jgi:hypothetical protein